MKRIYFILISLFVIASLSLAGCKGEAELGTEENPIQWVFVPAFCNFPDINEKDTIYRIDKSLPGWPVVIFKKN